MVHGANVLLKEDANPSPECDQHLGTSSKLPAVRACSSSAVSGDRVLMDLGKTSFLHADAFLWPPHTVGQTASRAASRRALCTWPQDTTLWNSSSLVAALSQSCFLLLLLHRPASTRHTSHGVLQKVTHTLLQSHTLVSRGPQTSAETQDDKLTDASPC